MLLLSTCNMLIHHHSCDTASTDSCRAGESPTRRHITCCSLVVEWAASAVTIISHVTNPQQLGRNIRRLTSRRLQQ